MVSDVELSEQLQFTLSETNFSLPNKYIGKVRDNYSLETGNRLIVTTDRISAFDRVLTTIPFKGQVLNQISAFWFDKTKDIVENHVIDVPDPNVMVVKNCKTFPIELVVRGYLTGSAWRDYNEGKDISGIFLPKGLKKHQKFDSPVVTPSTKAEFGAHDIHISREEIIGKKLVAKKDYEIMERYALALYKRGVEIAAKQGLILVDTKYEFGQYDGKIILVDEMHTPDSSRYWYANTYAERFEKGEEPQILDKEFLRQWLITEKNFMGDGNIPEIPTEIKLEVARRYIKAFEEITGTTLKVEENKNLLERIEKNLKEKGYLK